MGAEVKSARKYDLENRLIQFSSSVIDFVEKLPKNEASKYLGNQLMRSAVSPSLNYTEAQGAESRKDFIHKMRICLKELRETSVCLSIIETRPYVDLEKHKRIKEETSQLLAIFQKSVKTAASATS